MNNRMLILDRTDNFVGWAGIDSVDVAKCYASTSVLNRVMRRTSVTVACSLDGGWKKSLPEYSCVMMPDSMATNGLLKWIKGRATIEQRRIILLRNKVETISHFSFDLARRLGYEIWSYSNEDCDKYGFSYYRQFMNRRIFVGDDNQVVYDASFLGFAKDRGSIIRSVKDMLDSQGLKTWFFVPGMDDLPGNMTSGLNQIEYDDYLKVIKSSKAVVDLVSKSNYGMTLRPLEALFAERKLITNYNDIKNEEYYHPDNIFLIGEDTDISAFMDIPYRKIDESIVEKYNVDYLIRHIMRIDTDSAG